MSKDEAWGDDKIADRDLRDAIRADIDSGKYDDPDWETDNLPASELVNLALPLDETHEVHSVTVALELLMSVSADEDLSDLAFSAADLAQGEPKLRKPLVFMDDENETTRLSKKNCDSSGRVKRDGIALHENKSRPHNLDTRRQNSVRPQVRRPAALDFRAQP